MSSTPSTLNIGILAHVDAGKTSLTERLLYDHGAIDRLGSVDAGDTRTDTGAIERRRGITVRTAVAPFTVGGVQINLIDTPGHHDFIAEVERALGVLDGAVLLLSAVEGVQAQTRVLMRTLQRLRLPTLVFVNKIDRAGAREAGLLADIRRLLTPYALPLATVRDIGTPAARTVPLPPAPDALAEVDDGVLERLVDGPPPAAAELDAALAARTADGSVHPLFFGSALGGQGVGELARALVRLVPPSSKRSAPPEQRAPGVPPSPAGGVRPSGTVFAIERAPGSGERLAYLRLYDGEVRPRQRLTFARSGADGGTEEVSGRVTSVSAVGAGPPAGGIAVLRGIAGLRVGDRLGDAPVPPGGGLFAAPSLETVVRAREPGEAARLRAALLRLADQDPLIRARPAPGGATSVLLYGEVQKEIVAETLRQEYALEADFEPTRIVCVERPAGTGEAYEEMDGGPGGFWATLGLRVEPGPHGSGVRFGYETLLGDLPRAFHQAVEDTVYEALRAGPHGWAVTDVRVTMTRSGYSGPESTAGDFRGQTPLVLERALRRAGTRVYEPWLSFEAEVPADALAAVVSALSALSGEVRDTSAAREQWRITGELPSRSSQPFERRLPGLTRGEGVWWTRPAADRPRP